MKNLCRFAFIYWITTASFQSFTRAQETLGNPKPLALDGDIASHLVEGVDRFLLHEIQKANSNRVS